MQMEIETIIEYGLLIVIDIDSTLNCIRQCDTKRMWTDRRQLCAVGWMVFCYRYRYWYLFFLYFLIVNRSYNVIIVVSCRTYVCVCVGSEREV